MRGQLRRASSSVAANYDCNIYLVKERDLLNSAMSYVEECQCFLDLAYIVKYITREEHDILNEEAQIILDTLKEKILEISKTIEEEEGA